MLICSCAVISDHDIELALLEIMVEPGAPLPTPGVVWRHLKKRMDCCGCAPLAVELIYKKLDDLEAKGLVCPCACASVKDRMRRAEARRRKPELTVVSEAPRSASVDQPDYADDIDFTFAIAAE